MSKEINLEDYFKYHEPTTLSRKLDHKAINEAALDFARVIDESVQDVETKKMAIFAVQQARMFANQGVTIDDLRGKYSNDQ